MAVAYTYLSVMLFESLENIALNASRESGIHLFPSRARYLDRPTVLGKWSWALRLFAYQLRFSGWNRVPCFGLRISTASGDVYGPRPVFGPSHNVALAAR